MRHIFSSFLFLILFLITPLAWAGNYTFEGQVFFQIDQESFSEIWDTSGDGMVGLPGAKVKIYDKDIITRNLLAETETNEDGWYDVTFSYSGPWTDPNPDIKIVITLNNNRTTIHNLYGKIYTWKSEKMPNLRPDTYNIGFKLSADGNHKKAANLHAILTWALNNAFDVIGFTDHGDINTLFPSPFSDHSFNLGTNFIHKNNLTSGDNGPSHILHESGHGLAYNHPNFGLTIDLMSSPYGGDGEHDWESIEPADTAFYEAWADFMSDYLMKALRTDPYRRLSGSPENIQKGMEVREFNEMGQENEGNIASALWDLTDAEDDEQIRFISATQTTPITDIIPWARMRNLFEVYGLEAVNSTYYFLHAMGVGSKGLRITGVYAVPKSGTSRQAIYLFPESERQYIVAATDNALYVTDSREKNLYRYPVTSIQTKENVLGGDSSFINQYVTFGLNTSPSVSMSYDSEQQAVYVVTTYSSPSVTLKIDDVTLGVTNLGPSPFTESNICLMFYRDRCYYMETTSTNEDLEFYWNTLMEYDPATGSVTDLLPNSDPLSEYGPFSFGSFNNVSVVIDDNDIASKYGFSPATNFFRDRMVFGSGARLYLGPSAFSDYNVNEIDLTTRTFMRQAGSSEAGTTNAANLVSSFEYDTEIVGDTNGVYYYAFVRGRAGFGITAIRRVELDPVGEYIEMYCGNDSIELDITDIYDSLDRSLDTMIPFDGMLATTFGGGNHSDLLINNWVQLTLCQTAGAYETAAKSTSASDSMDETVPSGAITWSIHDLTDATVYTPAKAIASGTDGDGDGMPDFVDVFPTDSAETSDFDEDGTGDNADTDDDNDGTADPSDAFPYDPTEQTDTDGDGVGNNSDPS